MKRQKAMLIRFTPDELEAITVKADKAGLSREAYCRTVLSGSKVKEAPTADVRQLIWEIRRVGSNINQILAKANTLGFVDAPELRRSLSELRKVESTIVNAYEMSIPVK